MAAIALVAVLAGGCGGGGGAAPTREEYASKLSAICEQANGELRDLRLTGITAFRERGERAADVARRALGEIRALEPPGEVRAAAKAFADATERIVADIERATSAARIDDPVAFRLALVASEEHGRANDAAARTLGAKGCVQT